MRRKLKRRGRGTLSPVLRIHPLINMHYCPCGREVDLLHEDIYDIGPDREVCCSCYEKQQQGGRK